MALMLDSDPVLAPLTDDADRGQAAFTRTGLSLYDLLVLRGLCPWVWRCPNERILAAYRQTLHNQADTRTRLVEGLEQHLDDVRVEQVGCVALFSGRA